LKSASFEKGWVTKNIRNVLFGFVTTHACDGQTDGQIDRIVTANTALA